MNRRRSEIASLSTGVTSRFFDEALRDFRNWDHVDRQVGFYLRRFSRLHPRYSVEHRAAELRFRMRLAMRLARIRPVRAVELETHKRAISVAYKKVLALKEAADSHFGEDMMDVALPENPSATLERSIDSTVVSLENLGALMALLKPRPRGRPRAEHSHTAIHSLLLSIAPLLKCVPGSYDQHIACITDVEDNIGENESALVQAVCALTGNIVVGLRIQNTIKTARVLELLKDNAFAWGVITSRRRISPDWFTMTSGKRGNALRELATP
jgi:hypothetical protein